MNLARIARSALATTLPLALAWLMGCGARTGLLNGQTQAADASADAIEEPVHDAAHDPIRDVVHEDALPPIDASPPHDAGNPACPDAGATLVYVITVDNDLYSFYPPSAAFHRIGAIACPASAGSTPFSMAVDRTGTAYVLFNDGELFAVDTADASCKPTGFVPDQAGFQTFGMGFVANTTDLGETLFVAGDQQTTTPQLGTIDVTSMILTPVAPLSVPSAELTGTGDGRLYAFYANATTGGSAVGEIDKATAKVIAENQLPTVDQGTGWAFAFWGNDFWLFTATGSTSTVTRFRPADGSVTLVANLSQEIVGAGVSTCAPQ